ncbi:hypothetical protein HDU67_001243 [Dinochytrium kinnereticum]|nr:hypothetical protein HDU67_001243 [Dinochytrium kinnereticum]
MPASPLPHPIHLSRSNSSSIVTTSSPKFGPDRFVLQELIGSGSFGNVYKGVDTLTGEVVAIKVVDLEDNDDDIEDIQREVAILSGLRSNLMDVPKDTLQSTMGENAMPMSITHINTKLHHPTVTKALTPVKRNYTSSWNFVKEAPVKI